MTSAGRRECAVITGAAQMAELEEEWNDLWRRAKGSVYQSYAVAIHSWNEIAQPAGHSLFCVVVRDQGKISLVFPLLQFRKGPCRVLRPLSANTAEMIDILFDPQSDYRQNAALAWRTIEQECDIIDMPYVRTGSVLDQIIQTTRNFSRDHDIAPRALLKNETDWELYEREIFSANAKKQLRRKRKKLAELGHMEFIEVCPTSSPAYARELVDWMFTHKRVWGERVGKHGHWMYSKHYQSFLRNWITDSSNSHAKIHVILIEQAPIAMAVVSYCVTHVDSIIAGFHSDPLYSKHSPGLILDDFFMRGAFEKRLDVEFGVGSEPYKLFWSRNAKSDVVSYHVPTNLLGGVAVRLWRLRRNVMRIAQLTKRSMEPAAAAIAA